MTDVDAPAPRPAPRPTPPPATSRALWAVPAVVVLAMIVTFAAIALTRDSKVSVATRSASAKPFDVAYALSICGVEQSPLHDAQQQELGVHTFGDGLIHVTPGAASAAGNAATLGVFFTDVGLQLDDQSISDGQRKAVEGMNSCDGKDSEVAVAVWHNAADADAGKPADEVRTTDFGSVALQPDGAITIAFHAKDEAVAPPKDAVSRIANATEPAAGDTGSPTSAPAATTAPPTTATPSVAGQPCVAVSDPLPAGAPDVPVAIGPPPTQLVVQDIVEGTGAVVTPNQTLSVDYIGVACSNGHIFDSSYAQGQPATFALSGVIAGWQQGLPGMKVGGRRLLGIPPDLAYGDVGAGGVIAPGETLWFVIDVHAAQ
jgi:peptidylprolyl isomerase